MTAKNDSVLEMINPKDLVMRDNSRFRADGNQSELMESIKQHGILQPITARAEDNVVICGNRRLAAAIKLRFIEVPVRFLTGIDDKQLQILNLLENMQRKDISSIEIGRQCDLMLKNSSFKLSISELGTSLGVPTGRIKACIVSFQRLPAEYRDKVVHINNPGERKFGDLPENIALACLNFSQAYGKISDKEVDLLLKKVSEDNMSISQVSLIGHLHEAGMSIKEAIKEVDNYIVIRVDIPCLKTELASVMKREKIHTKKEIVLTTMREKYPNLIF